jgi:hypothetical protein
MIMCRVLGNITGYFSRACSASMMVTIMNPLQTIPLQNQDFQLFGIDPD